MTRGTVLATQPASDVVRGRNADRSFLSASILISTVRFAGRGTAFAAALIASRNLTPAEFGTYAYVITFLTAINLVGGLGLEQLALTAFGRARAKQNQALLGHALSCIRRRAAFVLPAASLVFAVPLHAVLGASPALLAAVATGICLTAIVISASVLRALDEPLASSVAQESGRGPALLLGAGVLYTGGGLPEVWAATLVFSAVFAAAASIAAVRAARRIRCDLAACSSYSGRNDVHLAEDVPASTGQFHFFLIVLATNVFLWVCPVILERSGPISEVGLFNVAMQFPALISFLSTSLEMTYVPKIAAYWHAGRLEDIRPFIRSGSRLTLLAGIPILATLVIFGASLLRLYGAAYVQAFPAMLLIVAAQSISVFCGPCGYLVLLTGRETLNLAGMAAGAVSGIVCLAVLAGAYGHMAAAVGFLIATAISNIWFALYCIRRLGINSTITAAFE
jgi:O-antigen/teichoic acid export membrane protein